jgi:hypothetical protein
MTTDETRIKEIKDSYAAFHALKGVDALKHHYASIWTTIRDLLTEIDRLEKECFALSAGVCEHRSGNDHGNPLCLKTNELI